MKFQANTRSLNHKLLVALRGSLAAVMAFSVLAACTASGSITGQPSPQPSGLPLPMPSSNPSANPPAMPSAAPTVAPSVAPTGPLTMYALIPGNVLLRFSSATPSTVTPLTVTGLPAGHTLIGIDFRPSDNKLYAVTTLNRMFTIDTNTGTASAVSAATFTPALTNPFIGFDFNPTVDRIRVQSLNGQNLRLNPVTGNVAATDTNLRYADGDINAGATPALSGSAYTNSTAAAASTQLYAIDDNRDILVRFEDGNNGAMSTVGPLGVNTNPLVGFDIAGDGRAFAAMKPSNVNSSVLYSVNLQTGASTLIENIGGGQPVIGLAISP